MSHETAPFDVAEVVEYLETYDPHELMSWGDHLRGALAEVERLRALCASVYDAAHAASPEDCARCCDITADAILAALEPLEEVPDAR